MKLEVLLSVMNLRLDNLDKMNITSDCVVINQCDKNDFTQYKNFRIYSCDERGLSNSRNKGLDNVKGDIIVLCDDDVVYNKDYERLILEEFDKNKDADIITFNIDSPNREIKFNKKNKRLHFYNVLRYTSSRIAFRRESVGNIRFNTLFGAGAKYQSGEDTIFLVDCLKKGLKIYSSTKNIGIVYQTNSTWFNGYNEKFFYDKGAVFAGISRRFRIVLILQYLLRHKEVLKEIKFFNAFKLMVKGSKDYIKKDVNI
ncbi:MAG: glycosyltransferase family 2 protein [Clostridia bacterium]|nr:glycosyltransferase family 2 protein [Clostridia bacterium]